MSCPRRWGHGVGQLIIIAVSWEGTGVNETGTDVATGHVVVRVDPGYFRPAEVEYVLLSLPYHLIFQD